MVWCGAVQCGVWCGVVVRDEGIITRACMPWNYIRGTDVYVAASALGSAIAETALRPRT